MPFALNSGEYSRSFRPPVSTVGRDLAIQPLRRPLSAVTPKADKRRRG
jgi:hypothetical protein